MVNEREHTINGETFSINKIFALINFIKENYIILNEFAKSLYNTFRGFEEYKQVENILSAISRNGKLNQCEVKGTDIKYFIELTKDRAIYTIKVEDNGNILIDNNVKIYDKSKLKFIANYNVETDELILLK